MSSLLYLVIPLYSKKSLELALFKEENHRCCPSGGIPTNLDSLTSCRTISQELVSASATEVYFPKIKNGRMQKRTLYKNYAHYAKTHTMSIKFRQIKLTSSAKKGTQLFEGAHLTSTRLCRESSKCRNYALFVGQIIKYAVRII